MDNYCKTLLAILLTYSISVYSADFQAGLDAYNSGDYATALKEWRPLAETGDADAQNNLGVMYDSGYVVCSTERAQEEKGESRQ